MVSQHIAMTSRHIHLDGVRCSSKIFGGYMYGVVGHNILGCHVDGLEVIVTCWDTIEDRVGRHGNT